MKADLPYRLDHWQRLVWESPERFYVAELMQGIFGDWCVVCTWGGRLNLLGRTKTYWLKSSEEGLDFLERIDRVRQKRGYLRLSD